MKLNRLRLQELANVAIKEQGKKGATTRLMEVQALKGKVGEYEFINWVYQHDPKAAAEIQDIDTSMMDSDDLASEYFDILQKYKIPGTITDVNIDSDGYVSWVNIK